MDKLLMFSVAVQICCLLGLVIKIIYFKDIMDVIIGLLFILICFASCMINGYIVETLEMDMSFATALMIVNSVLFIILAGRLALYYYRQL